MPLLALLAGSVLQQAPDLLSNARFVMDLSRKGDWKYGIPGFTWLNSHEIVNSVDSRERIPIPNKDALELKKIETWSKFDDKKPESGSQYFGSVQWIPGTHKVSFIYQRKLYELDTD